MDWAGWALFGLVATAALTAVMIAAQLAGLTRLDLPLLLGTIVTEDPDRARVAGFFIHLAIGQGFALGYAASFALLDRATWWLGGLFGLLHVAVALTVLVPLLAGRPSAHGVATGPARSSTAVLEPPGLLGLNYGAPDPASSPSPPTSSTASPSACSSRRADMRRHGRRRRGPIADRGLRAASATPAPPRSSAPTAPSTGCACPASTASRCSAGSSAGRRPGTFRLGPAGRGHGRRPPLPARTPPPSRRPGTRRAGGSP